jgi:RNA polymerase sigma-70 factor (ECF subfamily)
MSQAIVDNDFGLIDQCLAGRSAAFGELVTRHQDRLYNTLVHVLGSEEDAREIAQDAFVQSFVKLETFHRSCAFYTWLYRIAMNLAMSRRRRRKNMASVEEMRASTGREPIDGRAAPEQRLAGEERACQVRAALATLSDEHRTVLVLREIEGHDYDAIAGMLEVPLGTVRSRLHRARLQLRNELQSVLRDD